MELGPQISRGDAQYLANFVRGHSLDLAKAEGVGHRRREPAQAPPERVPELRPFHLLQTTGAPSRGDALPFPALVERQFRGRRFRSPATLSANVIGDLVSQNPDQPGALRGLALEPPDALQRGRERFLHQVFRFRPPKGEQRCVSKQGVPVPINPLRGGEPAFPHEWPSSRIATRTPIDNRQSTIDNQSVRVLIVDTYYPEFLADLYRGDPGLAGLNYEQQLARIYQTAFSVGDAYSAGLRALGCETAEVICNADTVQAKWAAEIVLKVTTENINDRRRQVVAAQIERFHPDVLYVFEWCPLGDAFLAEMKSRVRLLVGQIASPLPANRTFAAYDLMISSFPPIVEHFRGTGIAAESLRLAFDARLLDRLPPTGAKYDVTFVGGFAPSHTHRIAWLESLLREVPIDIFGYGLERVPPDSPIQRHYRGPAWGMDMYRTLQQSKITLNLHARIDLRGRIDDGFANNMRLYEATGVGTCLLTDAKANLAELFEPSVEVATFTDSTGCVAQIRSLLADESRRSAIAGAGQRRTIDQHAYAQRMTDLRDILASRLDAG